MDLVYQISYLSHKRLTLDTSLTAGVSERPRAAGAVTQSPSSAPGEVGTSAGGGALAGVELRWPSRPSADARAAARFPKGWGGRPDSGAGRLHTTLPRVACWPGSCWWLLPSTERSIKVCSRPPGRAQPHQGAGASSQLSPFPSVPTPLADW